MDKELVMWFLIGLILVGITLYSTVAQETEFDTDRVSYEKEWKVGMTQVIEVFPDKEYIKADIQIFDSDEELIKKDVMYSPNEKDFVYHYFVGTNTIEDRYTINITLDDFYENENIVFQVNVKQLNLFERVWLFVTTHIPQIAKFTDKIETFIYKITN